MKTIDNTIRYFELLMKYNDTSIYKKYELPKGYHYEFYKLGDEEEWINIHIESGEFTSYEKGLKYFHDFYDSFIDELPKRCFFIVDSTTNEKIATATISLLKEKEYNIDGAVDWFAIKRNYQGKKLSKPLLSKILEISNTLGHKEIILHTQTTSPVAAKLYLDYGFEILNKDEIEGWSILKTLINHDKLNNYNILSNEEIYDQRNIKIEKQLKDIHKTDNFNYSIWYKNNRNDVYVYLDNNSYEYKYYYEGNNIRLEEVNYKYRIRRRQRKDCFRLAQVVAEAWNETYKGLVPDWFLEELNNNVEERGTKSYNEYNESDNNKFVLEVDGEIVGFTNFGPTTDEELNNYGEIFALYVLKEYKGNGYGKKLVETATQELKKMGFDKMIIACLKGNPSNEFYKHIGGKYLKDGEYKRLHLPENIYYFDI